MFENLDLTSVEAYDYHENKWSSFRSMLKPRSNHTAVSIGNKIFIVGGFSNNCEVFNSVSRKFTRIKNLPKWTNYLKADQIVCVAYKVYLFFGQVNNIVEVHSFDLKNYIVEHKASLNLDNTKSFSCTTVPMY